MSDDSRTFVDPVTAGQLRDIQSGMLEQLKILTSEENLERGKTVIVQQAMLIHSVDKLNQNMEAAGQRLELAVTRINAAFMSLIKVPVACILIAAASWAYLYKGVISENTWLIMMAVAAFPWMGDSITAITKMFGIGKQNNGGATRSNKPD